VQSLVRENADLRAVATQSTEARDQLEDQQDQQGQREQQDRQREQREDQEEQEEQERLYETQVSSLGGAAITAGAGAGGGAKVALIVALDVLLGRSATLCFVTLLHDVTI
jgi:hypothetical protein